MNRILSLVSAMSLLSLPLAAHSQQSPGDWFEEGRAAVERNLALRAAEGARAKNVILFVGDGMGVSTVTAARILEGQLRGETGEENELFFETFPNLALAKTYNTDAQVPDSAGTMTAMVTGVKTRAGLISVSDAALRGDCASQQGAELLTFLEIAEMRGLATGVVSTARLTHATPASNYAHIMERNFESDADAAGLSDPGDCADIARQLIEFTENLEDSDGLEVALGGGRGAFLPNFEGADPEDGEAGNRLDGRDLTGEWVERHDDAAYVWNAEQFAAVDSSEVSHLLGLFELSHMEYELDRENDAGGEPSLSEMTAKAIGILSKNPNGYYLNVEAGRIDHAHHATSPRRALVDTIEFARAVQTAYEMVDLSETLIIVTADHSHVFTVAGYPGRGNPILGIVAGGDGEPDLAADGMPYTTLGYINGPNAGRDEDLSHVDTTHESFRSQTLVPLGSETHGGEDVAVYAVGPGSDLVRGVIEQNVIFHIMMEASQLDQR
ncbi:MAG: alkaline phosphatase [Gammaproteobacteria bacterium]|nr:alkaline phosphatase [Gammaproteobacteria bacterium]MYH46429.1 alkaline phosphatase [Gammaproteobacteria bacterium]MYL13361.1 alkaline phosphatase [Gammaproteobacteria bacterium]